MSVSDHGALSKEREQPQPTLAGNKAKVSPKAVSGRQLVNAPPPETPPGGRLVVNKPNLNGKKSRSKSMAVPGLAVPGLSSFSASTDTSPQLSPKRHSFQENSTDIKAQPKISKNTKPKAKVKVTMEQSKQTVVQESANQQRKTSADGSPPSPKRRSDTTIQLSSSIHGSTPSSTPRGLRKIRDRKSALEASTTHLSGFKASRPSLQAHLLPMGSNSDVEVHRRTRLTADDVSVVRELKEPSPSRGRNNNNNNSKSKSKLASNTTLTYFGTPLVPLDIVNNNLVLKPKLNLMHHKDALQVLDEIKHMERGQLRVKVKSDATIERSREKRPLQRKQTIDLKCLQILKTAGTSTSATLSMTGFKGGPLENQSNQDRSLIVSPFFLRNHSHSTVRRRLLGVFDGHAESGAKFAEHCQQQLPGLLSQKLSEAFKKAVEDIAAGVVKNGEDEVAITKRVLIDSFVAMNESSPKEDSGGTTATVIYQQGQRIFVANAGDSRSIVAIYRKNHPPQQHEDEKDEAEANKNGSEKTVKVVYMSLEDKPDLPKEQKRLEARGGEIVQADKNKSSKVRFTSSVPGKVSATLSMSRSIGDWQFTPLGVIPDPTVDVVDLKDLVKKEMKLTGDTDVEDDVCIFAMCVSDGIMIESNEEAEALASEIAPSLFEDNAPHPLTACQGVIQKTAGVWEKRNKGKFRDDITIAVTVLRTPADAASGCSS